MQRMQLPKIPLPIRLSTYEKYQLLMRYEANGHCILDQFTTEMSFPLNYSSVAITACQGKYFEKFFFSCQISNLLKFVWQTVESYAQGQQLSWGWSECLIILRPCCWLIVILTKKGLNQLVNCNLWAVWFKTLIDHKLSSFVVDVRIIFLDMNAAVFMPRRFLYLDINFHGVCISPKLHDEVLISLNIELTHLERFLSNLG